MSSEFTNEALVDFNDPKNARAMEEALEKVSSEFGREYPLIINGKKKNTDKKITSTDPADPGTLCYAGKSHQRFAPEARLFVTYVCNLYAPPGTNPYPAIERLQRNMELYRPVGVLLPLPADRDRGRPVER